MHVCSHSLENVDYDKLMAAVRNHKVSAIHNIGHLSRGGTRSNSSLPFILEFLSSIDLHASQSGERHPTLIEDK